MNRGVDVGVMAPSGTALDVALHGLVLRMIFPVNLASAVASRFSRFELEPGRNADITVVCTLDSPLHEFPADGRRVYESQYATAVYSPAEDTLYAFHADGATMRCDPAAARAEISALTSISSTEWVVTRPLLTLALMELVRRHGLFPLHAACLARDDRGVLVCGPSGSGKSTLTIALLDAGLDFLGDDLVFLEPSDGTVRARGFPDELGIATAEGSSDLLRLPAEIDTTPPSGWPKARADVLQVAPTTRIVDRCEPRLILLLSDRVEPGVLDQVSADDALLELLPSILLTEPRGCAAHLDALATLTRSATIFGTAPRPDLRTVSDLVVDRLEHANVEER